MVEQNIDASLVGKVDYTRVLVLLPKQVDGRPLPIDDVTFPKDAISLNRNVE